MQNIQNNLEKFFHGIEDGQDLGHHRTAWWAFGSKIIAFFGRIGNPNAGKKSHTSIIVDVNRYKNTVQFYILESTTKKGVHYSHPMKSITKSYKGHYVLNGFRDDEKVYWSPDVKMTNKKSELLYNFTQSTLGKPYAKLSSLKNTYVERFIKLFTKFIKWFFKVEIKDVDMGIPKLDDVKGFYCSQYSARKDYEIGEITEEEYNNNPYPDPIQFFKNKKEVWRIK